MKMNSLSTPKIGSVPPMIGMNKVKTKSMTTDQMSKAMAKYHGK